ncbi:MAG TPA: rRNA maturation RNase YbeY [Candidatus Woesebacteria bacterium]|nr:rRNA maturation RNase YbeY [Candidatus Woesebacteria bacterium]HPR99577.1 rRNA maturation RNase YbeY [Candidatus Woesebacteria bacterium]
MKNIILIKHPKNWGLKEKIISKLVNRALVNKGYNKDTELSIYFVGRVKAKKLNIKYRKMDYIPQVLGFPMSKVADKDGYTRLGDIVICTQKLKYEARYFKKNINEILDQWLLHGVENLLK